MSFSTDIGSRPLAVLGCGVLGRRIACVWAAGGYDVILRDPSAHQRVSALNFIKENIDIFHTTLGDTNTKRGKYSACEDLDSAVKDAWLVIEAIPEKLELKIDTFAELAAKTPNDCVLASNSSSFKSRFVVEKMPEEDKKRVLNVHYYIPPVRVVELMTSTHTDPAIFSLLKQKHQEVGMHTFTVRKESTGFICNRLWAAIKRETMMILAEGVSDAQEIDQIYTEVFGIDNGPCAMMDSVGLDTAVSIEENYINERGLPSFAVEWLRENYVSKGRLGAKSDLGGFYPPNHSKGKTTFTSEKKDPTTSGDLSSSLTIYALDVGLGDGVTSNFLSSGKIYGISANGKKTRPFLDNLPLPDGISVSVPHQRIFWTNMNNTSLNNGSVESMKLDGSDRQRVLPEGAVHTPKQLTIDHINEKLYISDREGMRVHRVNFDGSNHEILVKTGDFNNPMEKSDQTNHCVGITVDPKNKKFYWTQKGPSKAGKGRIFRADIDIPAGETASTRTDIELIFENLPEPIDLELDTGTQLLYWTDRGEYPFGNTVNRAYVGGGDSSNVSAAPKYDVLVQHLHEAIGITLDKENNHMYFADMGGSIYRADLDGGNKTVIRGGSKATFTGICLAPSSL